MKCPFCSKDIMDGAVWCRYCQNHVEAPTSGTAQVPTRPWYGGAGLAPPDPSVIAAEAPRRPRGQAGSFADIGGRDATFNRSHLTESEHGRKQRRQKVQTEIQARLDEIQRLMEKGHNQEAANEALAARQYLDFMAVEDLGLEAEIGSLEQKNSLLEEMGYQGREPDSFHRPSRVVLPRITPGRIVLVALVFLAAWGAYTLHRVTSENALRQPGSIGGNIMILAEEGNGTLQPLPFQAVSLHVADSESSTLLARLAAARDAKAAWNLLTTRKGLPKAQATSRTDNVGNFKFDSVPPGDYYLLACSPHDENPVGWFLAVRVTPLKLTRVTLRVENAVTPRH